MTGYIVGIVPVEVRSRMVADTRVADTRPEMPLRRGLHAQGFHFHPHDRNLPGKPDIMLSCYRALIFAQGCFWHGHDCHLFKWPSTRPEFRRAKIARNQTVDQHAGPCQRYSQRLPNSRSRITPSSKQGDDGDPGRTLPSRRKALKISI